MVDVALLFTGTRLTRAKVERIEFERHPRGRQHRTAPQRPPAGLFGVLLG